MTSCHLIPTWHKWNVNADDVMMTWFTLYVNPSDVMSGMCKCTHEHGACALASMGVSKYLSGLVCMQANPNLTKINA